MASKKVLRGYEKALIFKAANNKAKKAGDRTTSILRDPALAVLRVSLEASKMPPAILRASKQLRHSLARTRAVAVSVAAASVAAASAAAAAPAAATDGAQ